MTQQEFIHMQTILTKYNTLFVEADLLRMENGSFRSELVKCYTEIARLKHIAGELVVEDPLDSIIPQLEAVRPIHAAEPVEMRVPVVLTFAPQRPVGDVLFPTLNDDAPVVKKKAAPRKKKIG